MKRFFELSVKPFFVVAGALTAAGWLDALMPRWTVENVQKLAFNPDYTIFVQHWGVLVGLSGIFLIIAAFRESWRTPILAFTALEKALFVCVVASSAGRASTAGFLGPAVMDALIVLYIVGYFLTTLGGARRRAQPQTPSMQTPLTHR